MPSGRLARARVSTAAGFTLVELMVVVAIISIMAGTMVNAVGGSVRRQECGGFARGAQYAMQRARAAATSDGFQRRLLLGPGAITIQRASVQGMAPTGNVSFAGTGDVIVPGPQVVLWAVTATTDVAAQSPSGPLAAPKTMRFYPDGSSDAATVYVTDATSRKKFKVYTFAATGMSRLVDQW